jgi:hypothetical protein
MSAARETPVAGLLTIDVAAELRKLAEGSLEGSWQAPAELVRRAVASGARRVDVTIDRRRVCVRDDGRPLPARLREALAAALDGARDAAARHAALLELETAGAAGLLSLLAMEPAHVAVQSDADAGTTIVLEGVSLDRGQARDGLRALARFAPAIVGIDGRELQRGFGPTLAEAALDPPLTGRVALVAADDAARVWLLQDGVVGAHLTLPTAPAFSAFVEMRPFGAGPASADTLRRAVEPYLAALVDQAVRLGLAAARSLRGRPQAEQRQLRAFLVLAARRRLRTAEVLAAPVFRAFAGEGGERWLSLLDLGREAEKTERTLWVVASVEESRGASTGRGPLLLLAADERSPVSEILGISFRTPPPPLPPSLSARLRIGVASIGSALRHAAEVLRPGGRRALVPEHALSTDERAFARALAGQLPTRGPIAATVRFCAGRGSVRRAGTSWWLPRENATVVASVRAVASDPAWIYPAALALFAGRARPTTEARAAWRSRSAR